MSKSSRKTVAIEFEAKYTNPDGVVNPEDILKALSDLGSITREDLEQVDLYFDTMNFNLGGAGLSLRIRSINENIYELTSKRNISEINGVFIREEIPSDNISVDLDVTSEVNRIDSSLKSVAMIRRYNKERLHPVITVNNHRIMYKASSGETKIKICHDTLEFSDHITTHRPKDWEIEIELQSTDTQLMEKLVTAFRRAFPTLVPQRKDKYRRALELLGKKPEKHSLTYTKPKFKRATDSDIQACLDLVPETYRGFISPMAYRLKLRMSDLSQLSLLPHPESISLALWQETSIANIIESNPFLHDRARVLPDSCFVAVDLPDTPLKYFEHTRGQHSIDVAYWAMRLAKKAGLSDMQIAILAFAGIHHDKGHTALCHSGEVEAQKRTNETHEDRTLKEIQKYKEPLENLGISFDEVCTVLEEKDYGAILSLADTLAYLERDGKECGRPLDDRVFQAILQNFAFSDGEIIFNEALRNSLRELLNFRFQMYRTVYYHPYSRIEEEMQQRAIGWAIDNGHISLDTLIYGSDPGLLEKMAELAALYPEIKPLVAGFFADYCAVYHYRPIYIEEGMVDKKSLEDKLLQIGFSPLDFIITLPDLKAAKKAISGKDISGTPVEIRADKTDDFHPFDSQTIVAFAPHLDINDIIKKLFRSFPS